MASCCFVCLTSIALLLSFLLFLEFKLLLQMLAEMDGIEDDPKETVPIDYRDITIMKQKDAELFHLMQRHWKSQNNTEKRENIKRITKFTRYKFHLEGSVELIGTFLYGPERGPFILNHKRIPSNDDLECVESTVQLFEKYCGSLGDILKYHLAFTNICKSGVSRASLEEACIAACSG